MNNKKSFTLIEMLVVIAIIGILSGVILISTSGSTDKARLAKAQAFATTTQTQLGYDLISEWKFDNSSNPGEDTWKANDFNNISGATYKESTLGECASGGCYSFDGEDDCIISQNKLGLSGNADFTISFWAYWAGDTWVSNHVSAVGNSTYSDNSGISTTFYNGRMALDFWNKRYRATNALSVKKWYFLAFVKSPGIISTTTRLYVDGGMVNGAMEGTDILPTTRDASVVIGRLNISTGRWWDGMIDDVRIYKKSLTSSQIKQQYVAGLDSMLAKNLISKEEYNEKVELLAKN